MRSTTVNDGSPQLRCAVRLGCRYNWTDLEKGPTRHLRPYNAVVAGWATGHDQSMEEYTWPARVAPDVPWPSPDDVWAATIAALPVGASVAGEVIGRQPFGVFIRIDGLPGAMGLAEIIDIPEGMGLPVLGARIRGEVLDHVEHNRQVRVRLHEAGTALG